MKSLSDDGNGSSNAKVKRQAEKTPRAISFQTEKDRERKKVKKMR